MSQNELPSQFGEASPVARTLRDLRATEYLPRSVKAEIRANLLARLAAKEPILPGIVGYEKTVAPQIIHGILSGHDMLLLGLRGQAKSRILRQLVNLLDPWIPIIDGMDIPDDPMHPTTATGRRLVKEHGDDTPIRWLHRSRRYHEKLATPDVTIADLIGEIDLIKHAEGRYLSDEETMHFGMIPRSNRGIFVLNELPDLAPRIQVGLFNILEERDVQIRGYPIRLDLDLVLAFSANPEDYTNRGRIVTPLKDRIGSVIRTHYPLNPKDARRITQENAFIDRDSLAATVEVPDVMHEIVEEMIRQARTSPHINQASGVSARASIAAMEVLISSAERRAAITGESAVTARISDTAHLAASCRGKIELLLSEDGTSQDGLSAEDRLLDALLGEAVKDVTSRYFDVTEIEPIADSFAQQWSLELSDYDSAEACVNSLTLIDGLGDAAREIAPRLGLNPANAQHLACVGELILESLYVNRRISKTRSVNTGTSMYG